MKKDSEILDSLVAGGLIGAALGALVKNDKKVVTLSAIAGAALLASFYASERAKEIDVPIILEENGILYEVRNGEKKLVKVLPKKSSINIQKEFILER
jgi:hypothetical protein